MVGRNLNREFEVLYPAFSAALAETIGWCARTDRGTAPHEALWSEALQDHIAQDAALDPRPGGGVWTGVWPAADEQGADVESAVTRVRRTAVARRQLLTERRIAVPEADGTLHGGRLIAFNPGLSTGSGHSAEASLGFFDTLDGAGWDGWVMAFDTRGEQGRRGGGDLLVLAWVPRDLLKTAAHGVLANMVECVWWPSRSADARACLMSVLAGNAK